MKICFITPKNFPVPALKGGAVETLINDFIDENEVYKQMDVDVISIYDKDAFAESKKYKYTKFNYFRIRTGFLFKFLDLFGFNNVFMKKIINRLKALLYKSCIIEVMKRNEYDFVITEGGCYYEYKGIYKHFPKSKSIFHLHNVIDDTDFLSKHFGYFLVISNFTNSMLSKDKTISQDRVKLLYNGVRIENFNKPLSTREKKDTRDKYGIKENERVIIFCGRIIKEKGVKELLLAYKEIYNECNARLLIVGNPNFSAQKDSAFKRELHDIAKGLNDKIIFTGHVYNKELYKLYNIADVAVFPHMCNEAFGLTIIEAMASGVPIITTNDGAIPELVAGTQTIILEKEDNKKLIEDIKINIRKVLKQEDLRNYMIVTGKERARDFSIQNYYKNYVKILEEINAHKL